MCFILLTYPRAPKAKYTAQFNGVPCIWWELALVCPSLLPRLQRLASLSHSPLLTVNVLLVEDPNRLSQSFCKMLRRFSTRVGLSKGKEDRNGTANGVNQSKAVNGADKPSMVSILLSFC